MGDGINGQATFFRQDGHWHILLVAPTWVLKDLECDLQTKGQVLTVGNYANGSILFVGASWDHRHPKES